MEKALVRDVQAIRLGVIGMTEGNGHPYSWSAILNGCLLYTSPSPRD